MWLFTDAIMQGGAIKLFNHGRMRRDFTYVDDVNEGVVWLMPRPSTAPVNQLQLWHQRSHAPNPNSSTRIR